MADAKRPDSKRRSPASRPGKAGDSGRGRRTAKPSSKPSSRTSPTANQTGRNTARAQQEHVVEPIVRQAAESVSRGDAAMAILVCGSGIGVSIVANKSAGVRAANCLTPEMARLAREHNDANVLTLGERLMSWETAREIVGTFLDTPASTDQRHARRVEKIHALTGC